MRKFLIALSLFAVACNGGDPSKNKKAAPASLKPDFTPHSAASCPNVTLGTYKPVDEDFIKDTSGPTMELQKSQSGNLSFKINSDANASFLDVDGEVKQSGENAAVASCADNKIVFSFVKNGQKATGLIAMIDNKRIRYEVHGAYETASNMKISVVAPVIPDPNKPEPPPGPGPNPGPTPTPTPTPPAPAPACALYSGKYVLAANPKLMPYRTVVFKQLAPGSVQVDLELANGTKQSIKTGTDDDNETDLEAGKTVAFCAKKNNNGVISSWVNLKAKLGEEVYHTYSLIFTDVTDLSEVAMTIVNQDNEPVLDEAGKKVGPFIFKKK